MVGELKLFMHHATAKPLRKDAWQQNDSQILSASSGNPASLWLVAPIPQLSCSCFITLAFLLAFSFSISSFRLLVLASFRVLLLLYYVLY